MRGIVGVAGECAAIGWRQQFFSVQNLQHAVGTNAPCRVDTVPDNVDAAHELAGGIGMLMRGARTVKRGGHRSGSTRLSTRQPVSADVNRGGSRIAPINDDHGLPFASNRTCALAAGKIGDTGLALPPALMRGTKAPYG